MAHLGGAGMTQPLPFPIFDGFTATASLSLSTDGPIDRQHAALAHAYDLAAIKIAPRPAHIGKIRLKPAAIVSMMAVVIEKAAVRSGAVDRKDFLQIGLRESEIDEHYREAFVLASQRRPALFTQTEAA